MRTDEEAAKSRPRFRFLVPGASRKLHQGGDAPARRRRRERRRLPPAVGQDIQKHTRKHKQLHSRASTRGVGVELARLGRARTRPPRASALPPGGASGSERGTKGPSARLRGLPTGMPPPGKAAPHTHPKETGTGGHAPTSALGEPCSWHPVAHPLRRHPHALSHPGRVAHGGWGHGKG